MRKLSLLLFGMLTVYGVTAYDPPFNEGFGQQADLPQVDWSQLITTDYVSDGATVFSVNRIKKGDIIQVRFYNKNMSPMYFGNSRKFVIDGYIVHPESGIVSVKGLSDGGISVILNTNIREAGNLSETITIKTNYRNYQLHIDGLITPEEEDVVAQ